MPEFVFVCCQVGAEGALKRDIAQHHPALNFAFSRPGFVTFKCEDGIPDQIRSPFARTFGESITSIKATDTLEQQTVEKLRESLADSGIRHLHVWKRDRCLPGDQGFEPFTDEQTSDIGQRLKNALGWERAQVNQRANNGDVIADVILVDPNHWFLAKHVANSTPRTWPGGVPQIKVPESMVSRAYLKMEEALRWSRLPISPADLCVELGSSPGGSCQCLLERGFRVIGIDPALMDERVLAHQRFRHIRARAADLKRKEYADAKWLLTDANLAPVSTLDAIEHIVTNRRVSITGMLLTIKLLDWKMTKQLDDYVARIQGWGYRHVRIRQLAFNRREVCVMAAKSKAKLRIRPRSTRALKPDDSDAQSEVGQSDVGQSEVAPKPDGQSADQ